MTTGTTLPISRSSNADPVIAQSGHPVRCPLYFGQKTRGLGVDEESAYCTVTAMVVVFVMEPLLAVTTTV